MLKNHATLLKTLTKLLTPTQAAHSNSVNEITEEAAQAAFVVSFSTFAFGL